MRTGEPSRTAQLVAAYRLGFDRPVTGAGDPEADTALAVDVAAAGFQPGERMTRYLRGRTAFFDRVVVSALDRGATQFVVLGAGYDGRSLRYATAGTRWFEVDHPDTQRDKRSRLERLSIDASRVSFVGADLAADDLVGALLAAGFVPDAATQFLLEGVALYLPPASLEPLFAQVRELAGPGTRFALSAGIPGMDADRRAAFAARVAAVGEPAQSSDAEVRAAVLATRWRGAKLSERATRLGAIVAIPVWAPGSPATLSVAGRYLERAFHRTELDGLARHLESEYGVPVTATQRLDLGVVRVDRADGSRWVARVLPAGRAMAATADDVAGLRFLADTGFPAERLAHPDSVSEHAGQAVVVTEFVPGGAARSTQQTFRSLGELLGRLHTLPGAPAHPGGAWHHLAVGAPTAEFAALHELLAARDQDMPEVRAGLDDLRGELAAADDLAGLPVAFTHPDLAPANAVAGADSAPVLIDWTGAGVAPRIWGLGFLLWTAGRSGPRHVSAVMAGYADRVRLEPDERARLAAAVGARPLVFDAWTYLTGRRSLTEVLAGRDAVRAQAAEIAAHAVESCPP